MTTYGLRAEGLVKRFGSTHALAGVDLAARQGTVLGVLGPNGAGKTTAVRILATLVRPDAGSATVGRYDVVRHADKVRRLIGLTGQFAAVDEDLTGAENLILIGRLLDLRRGEARRRAAELLDRFGLSEAGRRPAKTYSGGMRRRLDIAASLVGRPQVLYLDEPTTGLDPARRDEVWATVRTLVDEGVTVLLTTQYLEEADALADEITVMNHGTVIAHGTPARLKQIVGRRTIAVRPADPARLADVATILAAVTDHEPEMPGREVMTVPATSDSAFGAVVRRLELARIGVSELSLRLPSLDEVFYALTDAAPSPERADARPHWQVRRHRRAA